MNRLRRWLLALIAVALGLVALRLLTYPTFFANPGAAGYVIEAGAPLAIYALVLGALPLVAGRVAGADVALRVGAVVGLIGAATEIVDIALESLWALPQPVVTVATGVGMLTLFALFGVAGFVVGRRTGSFWLGLVGALACAVVAILLAVTFGFLLASTSLPQLARNERGDPDFVRSGWTDVRAFAIANTFDAGFTHLVEAPFIAAVLGAAGSGLGRLGAQRRAAAA